MLSPRKTARAGLTETYLRYEFLVPGPILGKWMPLVLESSGRYIVEWLRITIQFRITSTMYGWKPAS
jgi:hypothetical protein